MSLKTKIVHCDKCFKRLEGRRKAAEQGPFRCRQCRSQNGMPKPSKTAFFDCVECGVRLSGRRPMVDGVEYRCRGCKYPVARSYQMTECPCGTVFKSDHHRATYCTKSCARRYAPRPQPTKRVTEWRCILEYKQCASCFSLLTAKSRKRYCNEACAWRTKGIRHRVWFPTCLECGQMFSCRTGTAKRCQPCRVRHHWLRKPGRRKASKLVDYIGHRDKWKCGICGHRVSPGVFQHGNPWSKTVDHVVPESECRALGWEQDQIDDPANLRLAHMRCNSLRSANGGGEQLALVG